jgi:hypothetical protein
MPLPLKMPLFVDPSEVITRMQLDPNLSGTLELVTSGIIGAQLHVERIVGGRLVRTTQDDIYFLDSQSFSGMTPGGVYRVELRSGFIREDEPLIVGFSTGRFGDYADIDASLQTVIYPRGYVLLDAGMYADSYVRVQATTGFEDGSRPWPVTEDIPVYSNDLTYAVGDKVVFESVVYEMIAQDQPPVGMKPPTDTAYWKKLYVPMEHLPDAVYEAILAMVPIVLSASQTTNRSPEAEAQYKMLTDHANLLLQPFIRTKGFSFRPV